MVKTLFSLARSIILVGILEKWGMESFSNVETFLKVPRDFSFLVVKEFQPMDVFHLPWLLVSYLW